MLLDRIYWYLANCVRSLESSRSSASHVCAPCYAFYRPLLDRFPDDVVADDVYISLHAIVHGLKVFYSWEIRVEEVRGPRSFREFFRHKYRKGNAVLRELLRFLYQLPLMPPAFRGVFWRRLFQFTFLSPVVALQYGRYWQKSRYPKVGEVSAR